PRPPNAATEAEILEPLVQERRHHGGRAIERVLRRQEPECLLANPAAPALGHRHVQRVRNARARHVQGLDRRVPTDTAKLLTHERVELRPVSVGVDDRMVQAAPKLPGLVLCVGRHGRSSVARRCRLDDTSESTCGERGSALTAPGPGRRRAPRSPARGKGILKVAGLTWDRYEWPLATG